MAEAPNTEGNGTSATTDQAPVTSAPVLLYDRYLIDPQNALPDFDSPSAKAYTVEDRRDAERQLFALICTPGLPSHSEAMAVLRGSAIKGFLPLVEQGPIDWPLLDQGTMAVIYERPLGGRLAANFDGKGAGIYESELPKRLIEPLVGAIQRLSTRDTTHRAIRPDNMFFMDEERQSVVLGDCVVSPPGFDQPTVFETIERGMASPGGRGEGNVGEDIYALGISIAFVGMGTNPVAGLNEGALLKAKVEQGTYTAICGNERMPTSLIEPVRGMVSDDPDERWGFEELEQWIAGQRQTPIPRKTSPIALDALEFAGVPYMTARTLAHAFSQNVPEAAKTIKGGHLDDWLRRQLSDAKTADAVAESIKVAKVHETDPLGSDDFLVSKICIFLDTDGPIRYKGISYMLEGFGPCLAVEMLRRGEAQLPAESVLRGLPEIWLAAQSGGVSFVSVLESTFAQVRSFLVSTEIGYGIERCLYELNPGLPCLSPHLVHDYVTHIRDLLPALDETANRVSEKTLPIDRHIAAFIAARSEQDVGSYLSALGQSDPKASTIGMLSLVALLQWRMESGALFGLTPWVGGQLGPAISSYHSRSTRRQLEREIPRVIRQGDLPELYNLIDNKEKRQADTAGFGAAQNQFVEAETEIGEIENSDSSQAESAELIGQQTAAMSSVVLTMIVITILFLMKSW